LEHEIREMREIAATMQQQAIGQGPLDQPGIPIQIFRPRENFGMGPQGLGIDEMLRRTKRPHQSLHLPRRCSITGSRMASTFSTPRRQICAVASTMVPTPRSTATLFHGSPTQIPSTSPHPAHRRRRAAAR
jgi:hypothetical protein